jgi:hypothetical protein
MIFCNPHTAPNRRVGFALCADGIEKFDSDLVQGREGHLVQDRVVYRSFIEMIYETTELI